MPYTLQNQYLRVGIQEQGAELTSLFDLTTQTEHLWQADPNVWPWHAPNLFPVVGGQTNDQLLIDGQTYPMKRHGFARTSTFTCTESSDTHAVFELRSSEATKQQFPYEFVFEISYTLDDRELEVKYRVKNLGTTNLFMSLGAHPAFAVPFAPDETYTDYYIEFAEDDALETSTLASSGLLSGEKQPVALDKRRLNLTPTLFDNDALVLLTLKSRSVTLRSHKNPHHIRLDFALFPYLGIWAKPGASFVCIEPWLGVADTENKPRPIEGKQGIQRVTPKSAFVAHYTIHVNE
ncbi:aldose 1-epimerase family protein [Fibrella sp. WM1]|uniref:aldose 1-epimerase family protein n=1 Tax=Fibrella musci TaxID=3242485 RepID=UPI003521FDA8